MGETLCECRKCDKEFGESLDLKRNLKFHKREKLYTRVFVV